MNPYPSHSDSELLALLKDGDQAAFTEIYNRYWEKMVTIAYLKLQSTEDAKEVVQDLFVDIWNRREVSEVQYSLHTYISGALRYKIYSCLAKKQKEHHKIRQLPKEDICNNTEEWLSYEALKDDLEKAVLELPEKCRLVFRLSRENGLSNQEIANALDISPKTVENHLTKALGRLHTALKSFLFLFV